MTVGSLKRPRAVTRITAAVPDEASWLRQRSTAWGLANALGNASPRPKSLLVGHGKGLTPACRVSRPPSLPHLRRVSVWSAGSSRAPPSHHTGPRPPCWLDPVKKSLQTRWEGPAGQRMRNKCRRHSGGFRLSGGARGVGLRGAPGYVC